MIEKIITSDLKSGVTEVEKDQVFVKLNTGATTFYSFANIKPEDIELDAITSVGRQLPTGFDQRLIRWMATVNSSISRWRLNFRTVIR